MAGSWLQISLLISSSSGHNYYESSKSFRKIFLKPLIHVRPPFLFGKSTDKDEEAGEYYLYAALALFGGSIMQVGFRNSKTKPKTLSLLEYS